MRLAYLKIYNYNYTIPATIPATLPSLHTTPRNADTHGTKNEGTSHNESVLSHNKYLIPTPHLQKFKSSFIKIDLLSTYPNAANFASD